MLKKLIFCVLLVLVTAIVYASGYKDMSACLPDNIGDYKSSKDIVVTDHKEDVLSVSRQYQYENKTANVSLWKIPPVS